MATPIEPLDAEAIDEIFAVINAAATAYRGEIPPESDTRPYMPMSELEAEFEAMSWLGWVEEDLIGVIGVQEVEDVSLIRHLYVRPEAQRTGVGSALLSAAVERARSDTVLVGTWRAATWAIEFYENNEFTLLGTDQQLLEQYWDVPKSQREASVVLRYEPGSE